MINVSELMTDPDFATTFTIKRMVGSWVREGEWQTAPTEIPGIVGIIQPAKSEYVLRFVPEGERSVGYIAIYCNQEVQMGNGKDKESDVVVWNDQTFRVAFSDRWAEHGFWFAIAQEFK